MIISASKEVTESGEYSGVTNGIGQDKSTITNGNGHTETLKLTNGKAPCPLNSQPTYRTFPARDNHEEFLRQTFELILKENVFDGIQRDKKVCDFKLPEKLPEHLNFDVGQPVRSHEELLELIQKVSSLSVKTGHPYFVNQLFSG